MEQEVLELRQQLRTASALGEYGAAAIRRALVDGGHAIVPAERTIGRILARHGAVDHAGRTRRPAPPPGWHLPRVAYGAHELDAFDVIEDFKLRNGPLLDVLTGVSLRGGLPAAWPLARATTTAILPCLAQHWAAFGRPTYAQFDNDTRFQGAHHHVDTFGRVTRFCLQLGITPVFVAPYEFGLQNAIEHFNGLYTAKVWQRFHFPSLDALCRQTAHYLTARRTRLAERIATAPPRRDWEPDWTFHPELLPAGTVIFIRRTSEHGRVRVLGHDFVVDAHWCHRLVRTEVDLAAREIRCFALRRRHPDHQPLLTTLPYRYPRRDLQP